MLRTRLLKIVLVLLMALTLGALGMLSVASGNAAREDQIRAAVAAWEDAYADADVERLMDLYADDVVSMPPGYPTFPDKAALREDFEWLFNTFDIERDFNLADIKMSGNLATRRGTWTQKLTPKDGGEAITEAGKCVMVYEKYRNEWKIVWEIWSTDG